ncbi:MAG: GNAT family N-acetyltransferase [Paracoccus sp. (in: a-proteobacteria)]|jgi:GNAT superfamily N-acetyltransferase|uniref:GNAT family N-acetyltransferase n=1 Tax=unclassified Paracoccus (in: a-proteobacteria) TaxID=2688777 RepID=UPI000C50E6CC|nr:MULTISPECIES: GNAT family N-acetyltransferase [unclassified Paracoccus (in: a-proteobacteria)]MAN57390.1 GNAT family N-acetyltransferase [Paracoccus sp. (in: a-proteobacteria)]MBA49156.1 GNAT family N-acetyltransferase [Paracoccus sp. (in: a-proteobacteria)]|tara:strand:- start:2132 stop:2716 length:585 start_codon:yes stop_codon:yes gene_type:complete
MSVTTRVLTGESLAAALDDVARLRIAVFRDWPYLYDGNADYERDYLRAYRSPGAVVVAAMDGARIVGAATGAPMTDHAEDFATAFADRPEKLSRIFYCAESVLLPAYRGRGIGHAFFDAREAHARDLGHDFSAFCSVIRPADHPARPADYRPLDDFWRKRGYAPLEGVFARFSWKDLGQPRETEKKLQFWMRPL